MQELYFICGWVGHFTTGYKMKFRFCLLLALICFLPATVNAGWEETRQECIEIYNESGDFDEGLMRTRDELAYEYLLDECDWFSRFGSWWAYHMGSFGMMTQSTVMGELSNSASSIGEATSLIWDADEAVINGLEFFEQGNEATNPTDKQMYFGYAKSQFQLAEDKYSLVFPELWDGEGSSRDSLTDARHAITSAYPNYTPAPPQAPASGAGGEATPLEGAPATLTEDYPN